MFFSSDSQNDVKNSCITEIYNLPIPVIIPKRKLEVDLESFNKRLRTQSLPRSKHNSQIPYTHGDLYFSGRNSP